MNTYTDFIEEAKRIYFDLVEEVTFVLPVWYTLLHVMAGDDGYIGERFLYEAYCRWCATKELTPLEREPFHHEVAIEHLIEVPEENLIFVKGEHDYYLKIAAIL